MCRRAMLLGALVLSVNQLPEVVLKYSRTPVDVEAIRDRCSASSADIGSMPTILRLSKTADWRTTWQHMVLILEMVLVMTFSSVAGDRMWKTLMVLFVESVYRRLRESSMIICLMPVRFGVP